MQDTNENLLSVLTRKGILIKVSVSFWRGCKKLKPEDIGIERAKISDRLISLGHKRLLPKDSLAGLAVLEGRAHALVEGNTFPFLHGLGHFLPNTKLQEVTAKLKEIETEFWKEKAKFLEQYATLREKAAGEWRTMARKLVKDPERLMSVIEASFPFVNQMDRYFAFDVQVFDIALPQKMSVGIMDLAEHQEVVEARAKAVEEASAKIHQGVENFVGECVASLREQTAQLCQDMLSSINNCETGVHQKTLNRLVRFIDQFRQMNFVNDEVMERQLESVRKELLSKTAEEYRDSRTAQRRLKEGLAQLANQAQHLAKQDATELVQRFGELGRRKFHLAA